MTPLQPARGTHDLLPEDARRHRFIEDTAFRIAERYGYGEIITPIFEFTDLFTGTLGETSDVVTKEMYTFTDRSGESLTLRPEGTAGVARAFISNSLTTPLKLFYRGPMFRQERPQKGRFRQFHQVGIEFLGLETPLADVEAIAVGWQLLRTLGLGEKVQLQLNSLGDLDSRLAYRHALVEYLSPFRDKLSTESLVRLDKNPLRILDSKSATDQEIVAGAPLMTDSLTPEARDFFDQVMSGLTALGIPFTLNPKLVRGLDYYCHTAFEFTSTALGSQSAVLAGGRYDGLIARMGGARTPGIGWAAGVERLALSSGCEAPQSRPIAIIPMGDQVAALALADRLRTAGLAVDLGFSGNMKKRLSRAAEHKARFAVILGEDEMARGVAAVRDLDATTQEEITLSQLEAYLLHRGTE